MRSDTKRLIGSAYNMARIVKSGARAGGGDHCLILNPPFITFYDVLMFALRFLRFRLNFWCAIIVYYFSFIDFPIIITNQKFVKSRSVTFNDLLDALHMLIQYTTFTTFIRLPCNVSCDHCRRYIITC